MKDYTIHHNFLHKEEFNWKWRVEFRWFKNS